jgi:hypothetical protein
MENGAAVAGTPVLAQGTHATNPPRAVASLPGVVVRSTATNPSPMILVQAFEKTGKSCTTITTLVDYPTKGKHPLVLAFDKTGPDSCIRLGYQPHVISVREYPQGKSLSERCRAVTQMLINNKAKLHEQHGAIVVDCASTMATWLLDESRSNSTNPDPRSHYNDMMTWGVEFIHRVIDLGLPTVWLAWLSEAEVSEERVAPGAPKKKKIQQGGVELPGKKFRKFIAGRADHILVLERQPSMVGAPGASTDGFARVFHTAPWDNINAGGRYSHLLPEPAPAHMGYVLYSVASGKPLLELLSSTQ